MLSPLEERLEGRRVASYHSSTMQETTQSVERVGISRSASDAKAVVADWRCIARALCAAAGFAALTALAAQVRIPIPGTPVPVTLQTLVVVLAGMTLGSAYGSISMAFYVLLGLTGYGVLASEPQAGVLLPPTAGYLLGFVVAQPAIAIVSGAKRPWDADGSASAGWVEAAGSALVGHGIIFVLGVAWLSVAMNHSAWEALERGLLPFVPGTIVKVVAAAAIARGSSPAIRSWIRG